MTINNKQAFTPNVLHCKRSENISLQNQYNRPLPVWQTCLREIALLPAELNTLNVAELAPAIDVFQADQATKFMLEVVCGLKSPVLAETEVHGQFREYYKTQTATLKALHPLAPVWCEKLDQIAGRVRDEHLRGLGSQSYGSYARKKARGLEAVHVLGSGQLTAEILPWLIKSVPNIVVYYRNSNKAQDLMTRFPTVKFSNLHEGLAQCSGGLLVTAPIPADQISQWVNDSWDGLKCVLDYRSESSFDPLPEHSGLLSLQDIFTEIERSRHNAQSKVASAKSEIEKIASSLYLT